MERLRRREIQRVDPVLLLLPLLMSLVLLLLSSTPSQSFSVSMPTRSCSRVPASRFPRANTSKGPFPAVVLFLSSPGDPKGGGGESPPTSSSNEQDAQQQKQETSAASAAVDRTSFDQAGASLIEEEDQKRMEAMGDFDSNPNASEDRMEQMRAAIRARTTDLGMEKSKVSADYIQQKQQQAVQAGGAKAAAEQSGGDTFAGLDLSQISSVDSGYRSSKNSMWADEDGEVPSMFFDVDEELNDEEKAAADPIGQKGLLEQATFELQNTVWPDIGTALRKVALMFLIVAITGTLIIGMDKVLREFYTDILHFIPSKEELANYANRFDGLDLPTGWTDNMDESDVASFADSVNKVGSSNLPDL